jgi:ribonuclease VapC
MDASALLAFLQNEPGGDIVRGLLRQSIVSSVNWSEVVQKSLAKGADTEGLWEDMALLGLRSRPFTLAQAEAAARLWPATQAAGLSLGDRACLALGLETGFPVITADRPWAVLDIGLDIRVIR